MIRFSSFSQVKQRLLVVVVVVVSLLLVVVAAVDAVRRELAWLRHQQRVGGGHRARHGVPRRKRWAAHRLVSSSRLF